MKEVREEGRVRSRRSLPASILLCGVSCVACFVGVGLLVVMVGRASDLGWGRYKFHNSSEPVAIYFTV